MKHIAGWFRRNNTLMAQAKDLARQLQEAWDANKALDGNNALLTFANETLIANAENMAVQIHRVARERDEERRLRLEAEKKHRDIVWAWSDKQITAAAEELRDTYLENEALKLFVHMVHKDECASLLAGNKECDCGYDTLLENKEEK